MGEWLLCGMGYGELVIVGVRGEFRVCVGCYRVSSDIKSKWKKLIVRVLIVTETGQKEARDELARVCSTGGA